MKLKTVLNKLSEMAVRNVDRIGDFSADADFETSSMTLKTDRKLMRHPKTEALIRRALSRFPQTIDVKIINDRDIGRNIYNLSKHVKGEKLEQSLETINKVKLDFTTADINIVYIGSRLIGYSPGRGPFSAWMAIHRFWQEMFELPDNRKAIGMFDYSRVLTFLNKAIYNNGSARIYALEFRSARDDNVLGQSELVYEILTEYCMMGKVRYKPAREVWDYMQALDYHWYSGKKSNNPTFEDFEKRYNKYMVKLNQTVEKIAQKVFQKISGKVIAIA